MLFIKLFELVEVFAYRGHGKLRHPSAVRVLIPHMLEGVQRVFVHQYIRAVIHDHGLRAKPRHGLPHGPCLERGTVIRKIAIFVVADYSEFGHNRTYLFPSISKKASKKIFIAVFEPTDTRR